MSKPKIIQIGFNKCGTRSLAKFFEMNDVSGYHYDKGLVGKAIQINLTTGQPPLRGFDDRVFYSDLMGPRSTFFEHQWYFREFYEAYPDSLFILNTRDMERWILSRLAHGEGRFADRCAETYGLADREEVKDLWRRQWVAQHARVRAFFADKPGQLLVFDIETDKGDALADFVKAHYAVDPEMWGHAGETGKKKREGGKKNRETVKKDREAARQDREARKERKSQRRAAAAEA